MSVLDFQPYREPPQESEPMDLAGHSPSPFAAPVEHAATQQRPVSVLGWGLALAGGALGWAAIVFALR